MIEQAVNIEKTEQIADLFGNFDSNIKFVEKEYAVTVISRGNEILVRGEPDNVAAAVRAVNGMVKMLDGGEKLNEQNIRYISSLVSDGNEKSIPELTESGCICITSRGVPVKPKTLGQKKYVEAIESKTVTIGVGPAGTGKTYLAVAEAVAAFKRKQVSRIILTRPAVEA